MPVLHKCRHCGGNASFDKVTMLPSRNPSYRVGCKGCNAQTQWHDSDLDAVEEWKQLHAWQYPHERDFEALQREYSHWTIGAVNRDVLVRRLGQFTDIHGRMVFFRSGDDGVLLLELGADPKEKP